MSRPDGDPTEEPTPQRLLKARQRGQVAVSRELSSGLGFVVLVVVVLACAPMGFARMLGFFRRALGAVSGAPTGFAASGAAALEVLVPMLVLPLGAVLVVGVLVGALQTGGLFSWQAARVDLTRLSPVAGLKRLFGIQSLVEIGKGLLKVTVVLAVATASLWGAARDLPRLAGARPASVLAALGIFAERIGIRVALALVILGTLDWLLVRRRHRRSLMMTRDEVKREYKDAEGDPRHRSERQRLHRELSEQRMIEDVRKADFVVVNPDHIAVAVKYDREADAAPMVVAKGERLLAERIKQVAREAGVPIYREVGLARALNELPEGEEIPEALYEAVAELLRVLWEMEQPRAAAANAVTPEPGESSGASRSSGLSGPPGSPTRGPMSSTWKRV